MDGCPLGMCDGSGFVSVDNGEDEDNCFHVDYQATWDWPPEKRSALVECLNRTVHEGCPWDGAGGYEPR